jgi:hypothetical protein
MRKVLVLSLAAAVLGCSTAGSDVTSPDIELDVLLSHGGGSMRSLNFVAPASGDQEVPARDTDARGNAVFNVSADGESMSYRLIVANIENVTQAHIHLGQRGANGGVVAWLYGNFATTPPTAFPGGGGPVNGVLATGTITSASLVGALAGQPLSALINHIKSNGAYVNVHTSQFPPGEVRGQITGGHTNH